MRNLINAFAFLFLGFVCVGCYDMHGLPPSMPMPDSGPVLGGDAGPVMPTPDAGMPVPDSGVIVITPDSGPVVMADAGSDAGMPPEPDAGPESDAGSVSDLIINTDNLRASTILVADGDLWQNVAQFRVQPDVSIGAFDVYLDGDAADIQMVAIAVEGRIIGSGTFSAGLDPTITIELSEPFVTPSDGTGTFQVWVRIPTVTSNAAVFGVRDGFPMSGDTFRVGISGAHRYIGSERLRSLFGPLLGNEFVIRASKPTVTRLALSTTTIGNGTNQDLYKFQVSASSTGSIVMARIGMEMAITSAAGRVCNLRLRRGSTEMSPSDYSISGPIFWGGERCWVAGGTLPLIIRFTGEQTVSGSGNVYTVIGTPSGFVAGDTIMTGFSRLADDRVITGYLGSVWSSTSSDLALDPSPFGEPGSMRATAGFIWSDLSEVPHLADTGTSGGSRDWTNGYLIEDLTQIQTLTR